MSISLDGLPLPVTFPVDPIPNALAEDIGSGDLTSAFLVPADHQSAARIFAKENAVVAGIEAARAVYRQLDPEIVITVRRQDGDLVHPGDTVLEIAGRTRPILTGERVALNFIQRLSGVATITRKFVDAVAGTGAEILDTRKTTPGLRILEKAAVKAGGARNHRMGLFDAVMVKDNHLLAHPDLPAAIQAIRQRHPKLLIEVEADSIEQVREFVRLEAIDVILLDNMSPEEIRKCVALRRTGLKFEASGGVSLATVRAIAEAGVDYISVGQLTHSAPSIDFSLELWAIAK
ncbi:MAG TPA: carboxylating nicotinate-nucleotide diphosphorylase [Chthoniobacterales bacterium]